MTEQNDTFVKCELCVGTGFRLGMTGDIDADTCHLCNGTGTIPARTAELVAAERAEAETAKRQHVPARRRRS